MRILRSTSFLLLAITWLAAPTYADKLKTFYSGSGGYSAQVHRVLFLELAKDGTAILQQNWHEKAPDTWHAHWTLKGKTLELNFDPIEDKQTPSPAIFTLKNNSLVPVKWDSQFLGLLGPPTLMPFGIQSKAPGSLSGCKMLDYNQPTGCVQWDSRDMKK